jgi:hypothetical protein
MRIATQEVMFRTGMVEPVAVEREIGSGAKDAKEEKQKPSPKPVEQPPEKRKSTATDGTAMAKRTVPPKPGAGANGRTNTNGRKPSNGKAGSGGQSGQNQAPAPKAQNRSRSKRSRKAR